MKAIKRNPFNKERETSIFTFFIWIMIGLTFPQNILSQETSPLPTDSLKTLTARVKNTPKDGLAWMRLGEMYIATSNFENAEKALKNATRYLKTPEAHNALGIALMRQPKKLRKARSEFKKALGKNRNFIQAQMNVARTYALIGHLSAEKEFLKVIQMDATYAPAYSELGSWYLSVEDLDKAIGIYKKYLDLKPNDIDAHWHVLLSYTQKKEYILAVELGTVLHNKHPQNERWIGGLAQAHAALGNFEDAEKLFHLYLALIPDSERIYYNDLSRIATPDELEQLEQASESEKEIIKRKFWQKRDPFLFGGTSRKVEHYRRVWYARHFFNGNQPWDKRGEIYVRYGEPDYRSRSGRLNKMPNLAVEQVKKKIHAEMNAGPAQKVEQVTVWNQPTRKVGDLLLGPIYPIERDNMGETYFPWESWIYTNLKGGCEFTFEDRFMSGAWDYPLNIGIRLVDYHPATMLQILRAETPDQYQSPPAANLLEFYYDLATFASKPNLTTLELYYGIPANKITWENSGANSHMSVFRNLLIANESGDILYKKSRTLSYSNHGLEEGSIITDVVPLQIPPGRYKMSVQVKDRKSDQLGAYVQDLIIPAYEDKLALSDIEFAWSISTDPLHDKFRKGDVWVLPMPNRSYLKKQNPFFYYEIYNLTKDAFGQTNYKVEYTVRQDIRKGVGVFGAVSAFFQKALVRQKPVIALSYNHKGTHTSEPIFFELDAGKIKSGANLIEITITDLNNGQSISKNGMFLIDQKSDKKNNYEFDPETPMGRSRNAPPPPDIFEMAHTF